MLLLVLLCRLLFLVVFWRWSLRVNCIKGEIHNIIASLRLGWAAHIAFLSDFKALHEQLCEVSAGHPPCQRFFRLRSGAGC